MEIIFDEKGYCKEIELNEIKSRKYKNSCDFLDEKEEEMEVLLLLRLKEKYHRSI